MKVELGDHIIDNDPRFRDENREGKIVAISDRHAKVFWFKTKRQTLVKLARIESGNAYKHQPKGTTK